MNMLNNRSAKIKAAKNLSEQKQGNLQNPRTFHKIWKKITLLDMYICLHICISMCMICMYTYITISYIHIFIYMFIFFSYICMYIHTLHIYTYIYIYKCVYKIYVYMIICVTIYLLLCSVWPGFYLPLWIFFLDL